MARNDPLAAWRKFAFDNMQIGAADTASEHAKQNVSRPDLGSWNLDDVKRSLGDVQWRNQNGSLHLTHGNARKHIQLSPRGPRAGHYYCPKRDGESFGRVRALEARGYADNPRRCKGMEGFDKVIEKMARPERFELPAF